MPATLSKADVLKAVETVPDEDLSIQDIVERLLVLKK